MREMDSEGDIDGCQSRPWQLVLATSNFGKQRETNLLLKGTRDVEHVTCTPPSPFIEAGAGFEEIAQSKLSQLLAELRPTRRKFCWVTEHSGLIIPSLAGSFGYDDFPGIRTSRWLTEELSRQFNVNSIKSRGEAQNAAILRLMENQHDRRARYIDVAAACAINASGDWSFRTFAGAVDLVVLEHEQGQEGWEYDRIVALPGSRTSLASLPPDAKATVGARAKIYKQVVSWLKEMEQNHA